ncbi:MAG TPA: hypothetical protein VIY73_15170, partial [Polyangiaceae bacterium]
MKTGLATGAILLVLLATGACKGRASSDAATIAPDPTNRGGNARTAAAQASAFRDGNGGPRDEARALQLFGEACESGLAKACGDLGAMFADGVGVPKDAARAAPLFQRACDGADYVACSRLGEMARAG